MGRRACLTSRLPHKARPPRSPLRRPFESRLQVVKPGILTCDSCPHASQAASALSDLGADQGAQDADVQGGGVGHGQGHGLLHPEGPGMLPSGTCAGRAVAGTGGTSAGPQHPAPLALCVAWTPWAQVAMRGSPSHCPSTSEVRKDGSPALPAAAPAEVQARQTGGQGRRSPESGRRWQSPHGGNVHVCVLCAWACVSGGGCLCEYARVWVCARRPV